jgi:hypothetical protein
MKSSEKSITYPLSLQAPQKKKVAELIILWFWRKGELQIRVEQVETLF